MRIIKLSPTDSEMQTRENVDEYFATVLQGRDPVGKFLLTKGRISKGGISPDERLVFSYKGEVVYLAKALSGREVNGDVKDSSKYPHFFSVDIKSIRAGCKSLRELEDALKVSGLIPRDKHIVNCQGWPIVEERDESAILRVLKCFSLEGRL